MAIVRWLILLIVTTGLLSGCAAPPDKHQSYVSVELGRADKMVTASRITSARHLTSLLQANYAHDWGVWARIIEFWLLHGRPEDAAIVAIEMERNRTRFTRPVKLSKKQLAAILLAVAASEESPDIMLPLYELVLKHEPQNSGAMNAIAYTLAEKSQQLDRALSLSKRAVALSPQDAEIRGSNIDTLGWIYYQRGDITSAVNYLRQAAELCPDRYEIRLHLASALLKSGDVPTAYVECRKTLILNKSSLEARSLADRIKKDYKYDPAGPL